MDSSEGREVVGVRVSDEFIKKEKNERKKRGD
jgi:hypothetical protein